MTTPITADITVRDERKTVQLVQCGLPGERHSWRVDAPGEDYDGWLVSDEDLTNRSDLVEATE